MGLMDWLRRNWPDLTIGVALVAVIALIVATLLSGGSLASLVRRDAPPELPVATTPGSNAAATTTPGTPADPGTAAATTDSDAAGEPADGAAQDGGVDVFVPGVPDEDDLATGDTGTGGVTAVIPPGEVQTGGTPPVTDAQEALSGPLPEASATGGFRVAAGALDARDTASTLAQSYRDDGYEVTVEQQNDLYLLWIGPYDSRADADTAAARIIADGGDALVYTYSGENGGEDSETDTGAEGNGADGDTSTPNPDAQAETTQDTDPQSTDADTADAGTPDADTTTDTTGAAPAGEVAGTAPAANDGITADDADGGAAVDAEAGATEPAVQSEVASVPAAGVTAGERYLQVGAFATEGSAEPLRAQLEALGLDVSSEDTNGLVRLFVGPFGDAQLSQAQTQLNAQGIDSFVVVR